MVKVYDWIEQNPKATRVWVLVIVFGLLAGLSVLPFLFIPGLLHNLEELHRQSAARFYGFVVTPAVIASVCALIWVMGDAWRDWGLLFIWTGVRRLKIDYHLVEAGRLDLGSGDEFLRFGSVVLPSPFSW